MLTPNYLESRLNGEPRPQRVYVLRLPYNVCADVPCIPNEPPVQIRAKRDRSAPVRQAPAALGCGRPAQSSWAQP